MKQEFSRLSIQNPNGLDSDASHFLMKSLNSSLRLSKRHENFSEENMDLKNHLFFDALIENSSGQIVTGCGIYNGGRYPEGVFRVLNRTFLMPNFRNQGFRYPFLATQFLLKPRLQNDSHLIDYPFVSREGINGGFFLEKWCRFAAEMGLGDWIVSSGFVHVAPRGNNRKCYQKIAFLRKNGNIFSEIPLGEWKNLEHGETRESNIDQ